MAKKEINELITSLKDNKSVILIGNSTNNEYSLIEESLEFFTRKNMVKNPEDYWDKYNQTFFEKDYSIMEYEKEVLELIKNKNINIEKVINFSNRGNISGLSNIIELNGSYNKVRCMLCDDKTVISKPFFNDIKSVKKCSKCNGKISPTITMYGEKYRTDLVNEIRETLFGVDENNKPCLNVENFIIIDADFNESLTHELIESFSALKHTNKNANLIIITKNQSEFINFYNADFATNDEIESSINRLIKLIDKGGNK